MYSTLRAEFKCKTCESKETGHMLNIFDVRLLRKWPQVEYTRPAADFDLVGH